MFSKTFQKRFKELLFYFSKHSRYLREYRAIVVEGLQPASYICQRDGEIRLMCLMAEPPCRGDGWLLDNGTTVETDELIGGIYDFKFQYRNPPF
jgi:hypothetical protein